MQARALVGALGAHGAGGADIAGSHQPDPHQHRIAGFQRFTSERFQPTIDSS
jgi:hypothetical protein